ncbi:hypothetical protein ART_0308 [Arthrobacter sp. PAMC 25486]|nr:hypothetical protein ART_0308 [Arthrobacter sp. PAMC 25486]
MELPTLRGDDLCGIFVSNKHLDVVVHAHPAQPGTSSRSSYTNLPT